MDPPPEILPAGVVLSRREGGRELPPFGPEGRPGGGDGDPEVPKEGVAPPKRPFDGEGVGDGPPGGSDAVLRIADGPPAEARRRIVEPAGPGLPETSSAAGSLGFSVLCAAEAPRDRLASAGPFPRSDTSTETVTASTRTDKGREIAASSAASREKTASPAGSRMAIWGPSPAARRRKPHQEELGGGAGTPFRVAAIGPKDGSPSLQELRGAARSPAAVPRRRRNTRVSI